MAEPLDDKTAFGIDLGTTMSVVAQVNSAGLPVVLPNAEGSPTTPSIVLFDSGHAVVGAVARESLATEPASVVQLVKRHIGSGWTFDYGGVAYRPEHVSALILRFPESKISLPIAHAPLLIIGTGLQLLLILIAFADIPYGNLGMGWGWAAFIGLLAALAAAAPVMVPAARSYLESRSATAGPRG